MAASTALPPALGSRVMSLSPPAGQKRSKVQAGLGLEPTLTRQNEAPAQTEGLLCMSWLTGRGQILVTTLGDEACTLLQRLLPQQW